MQRVNNSHGANIQKISHIMMISSKNFKNMGFSEYMKSLPYPRREVVEEIAEKCKVSNNSVYRWIQGKSKPNALCRGLVAEYLGMQESELFPDC